MEYRRHYAKPFDEEHDIEAHARYTIHTMYTNYHSCINHKIRECRAWVRGYRFNIVGIDMEYTPNGQGKQEVVLIQLCYCKSCLL